MKDKRKLVYGVGINDAQYRVFLYEVVGGIQKASWQCPFYRSWVAMLQRCHSKTFQAGRPTYAACRVADEWHSFSSFREWMDLQNWEGNQLDKDILLPSNKVYGPEFCVFVPSQLNGFLADSGAARGEWPIGVYFDKKAGKFRSRCRNPFTGKHESLGLFSCHKLAGEAWREKKHEHACRYADQQTDLRIAQALRTRYAKTIGEQQ